MSIEMGKKISSINNDTKTFFLIVGVTAFWVLNGFA